MRAVERTRLVPVIVLSTSTLPKEIDRARQLGIEAYVHKSQDFCEFEKALRHALLGLSPGSGAQ